VVRDRREALLVGSQRQQQVRDPVGRRQVALGGPHAEAVNPVSTVRHQDRAGLAEEPDPELPALHRQAGLALEVARVMTQEVAEESLRDRLSGLVARPARRPDRVRAAERVQFGDDPSVREARERDRQRERLERDQRDARQRERDDERNGLEGPEPTAALQVARINTPPPRNRGELGKSGFGH